jgi:hypothetical protein
MAGSNKSSTYSDHHPSVLPLAVSQGFWQVYHDADGHLSYFSVDEDRDYSQDPGLLTI